MSETDSAPAPAFSGMDVQKLFGVAGDRVRAWIADGCLEAEIVERGGVAGKAYRVSPEAVLRFVRGHADAYDPARIADAPLRALAEKLEARDPLVPMDELARQAGLTEKQLRPYRERGVIPVVLRGAMGAGPRAFIRRSQLAAAIKAIAAERERSDPLHQLHCLLRIEEAPVERPAAPPPSAPAANGSGARAAVGADPPQPAREGHDTRPACERCKARMVSQADEDDRPIWKCLSCGAERERRTRWVAPAAVGPSR